MRRISRFLVLLIIAVSVLLVSCGSKEVTVGPDEIVLAFRIDTSDDVYQIAVEYSSRDVFCGGTGESHADGSCFDDGETHYFVFERDMFPEETLTDRMSFSVMLADSLKYMDVQSLAGRVGFSEPCDFGPMDVSPGNIYRFVISGSFAEGFRLSEEL